MPSVDLAAIAFLAGCILTSLFMYGLHVLEVRRIERRHVFGLKRHPAFKDWEPQ